jgi:type II secretory pathway component PulL
VTGKQTIWFKKITAVFLLLVLFAVTVIQVSHSHNPAQAFNKQEKSLLKKSILPEYKKLATESKCFICEYQLTRDADASYFTSTIKAPVQYYLIAKPVYAFSLQRSISFFESRGPPVIAC